MSRYLVLRTLTASDGKHYPPEILEDPDYADRLMERGFVTPVPDDYSPPEKKAAESKAEPETGGDEEEARPPTADELLKAGYSQEAADALAAGDDSKFVEETEAIEKVLAERPEALRVAKSLEVTVSEVSELSDSDYEAVVKELPTEETGPAEGSEA